MLLILFVGAIAGIVIQTVVKSKLGEDDGANMIATGITEFVTGRIFYEAACINMEYDHYSWIGDLTGHEILYYILRYGGLLGIMLGAALIIAGFYWKCSNSGARKEERTQETKKNSVFSDVTAKVNSYRQTQNGSNELKEVKCPYCGAKQGADQNFCFSCGSKIR